MKKSPYIVGNRNKYNLVIELKNMKRIEYEKVRLKFDNDCLYIYYNNDYNRTFYYITDVRSMYVVLVK